MKITFLFIIYFGFICSGVMAQCRYMFVTSSVHPGYTRLADADDICRNRAATSPIPGISGNSQLFVAWMSNDTHDALWRIGGQSGDCFQNAKGELVATGTSELTSGPHQADPWGFFESGDSSADGKSLWTHTLPSGIASVKNCNNQAATHTHNGGRGLSQSVSGFSWRWSAYSSSICTSTQTYSFGCIQARVQPPAVSEGLAYPLAAPCDSLAFVSTAYVAGSSLWDQERMDSYCQFDARNSEYRYNEDWNSYRAVYSTSTRTAADMLANTLCIGNLIGRPFWKRDQLSDPFTFVQLPIWDTNAAVSASAIFHVWVGSGLDLSTATATCSDWSESAQAAAAITFQGENILESCSKLHRLLCVYAPADFTGPSLGTLAASSRLLFLTSNGFYNGNLGQVSGADTLCRQLAESSALPVVRARASRFIAYLSTDQQDALARLYDLDPTNINKPYISTNGALLFTGYANLESTEDPKSSLYVDESGRSLFDRLQSTASEQIYSGTARGGRFNGEDCNGWSDSSTETNSFYGNPTDWLFRGHSSCSSGRHLMCFEAQTEPTVAHYLKPLKLSTPSPCMYIFRTSSLHMPTFGTIETMDNVCVSLASASTIPEVRANAANFMALLSNSTLGLKTRYLSRKGSVSCWKNTDERLLVPAGGDLYGGEYEFFSTFWPDENGETADGSYMITGTNSDGYEKPSRNCNDWTGVGNGQLSYGYELSSFTFFGSCDVQQFFACIQFDVTPSVAPTDAPTNMMFEPTMAPVVSPLTQSSSFTTSEDVFWGDTTTPITADVDTSLQPVLITTPTATPITADDNIGSVTSTAESSDGYILPIIFGALAAVLLLICGVLLLCFLRRRGVSKAAAPDNVVHHRRTAGSSYYSRGDGSRQRSSAARASTHSSSRLSQRQTSRRSQRGGVHLMSSPYAAFDTTLPIAVDHYTDLPTQSSQVGGTAAAAAYDSEYVAIDQCAGGAYGSLSTATTAQYSELRTKPRLAAPVGRQYAQAPYGLMPSSMTMSTGALDAGDYETVELRAMP